MKFSTRAQYGLRAMLDLALHNNGTPILVKDIAQREQISQRYLEHLLLALKKSGLIRSIRGMKGGYVLAQEPGAIRVRAIVEALEGSIAPVDCVGDRQVCARAGRCASREVWLKIRDQIVKTLDLITLSQLAALQQDKQKEFGSMYEI